MPAPPDRIDEWFEQHHKCVACDAKPDNDLIICQACDVEYVKHITTLSLEDWLRSRLCFCGNCEAIHYSSVDYLCPECRNACPA